MKNNKIQKDFSANPDNVQIGDWVIRSNTGAFINKIGQITGVASKSERMLQFWVRWCGDSSSVSAIACELKKIQPLERDYVGEKLKNGRVTELHYLQEDSLINAEVIIDGETLFLSLEELLFNLNNMTNESTVNLDSLTVDRRLQQRVKINPDVVDDYAIAYKSGKTLPPITVWHCIDDNQNYLVDGFHRLEAAKTIGLNHLPFEQKKGTFRDAVVFTLGVNAHHGLRRSNADKRKTVMTLLNDSEWSQWSDRHIAKKCGVSNRFVSNLRKSICEQYTDKNNDSICERYTDKNNDSICERYTDNQNNNKRKVTRGGKTYIQDTTNIGNRRNHNEDDVEKIDEQIDSSWTNSEDVNSNGFIAESSSQDEDNVIENDKHEEGIFPEDAINNEFKGMNDERDDDELLILTDEEEYDESITDTKPNPNNRKRKKEKSKLINPLSIGEIVKVKSHHYFGSRTGEVTNITTSSTVVVAFNDNERHRFRLDELDLPPSKSQPIRVDESGKQEPSKPVKKEIYLTEGCNYKAGNPGYGCSWYVKVEEITYKGLQVLQKKLGTISMDAAIARFLQEEKILIPDPTNLVDFFINEESDTLRFSC